MTQKGLRANFNLPLQPRYRQQQPAAQILTKYSTPNTTMVTISCEGDNAISQERSVMESTLQNQIQIHNLNSAHLRNYTAELSAPGLLHGAAGLERLSDLCCCVFPHSPLGWRDVLHIVACELKSYTFLYGVCVPHDRTVEYLLISPPLVSRT